MNIRDKLRLGRAMLSDQDEALKDPYCAYLFARYVPGADIQKCQEVACKNSGYAYYFALFIDGANIEMCQESACKSPYLAYLFVICVEEEDIKMSLEACKGTDWEDQLNKYFMEMALK